MRATFEARFPEITFEDDEWDLAVGIYPCMYGAEWDTSPCDDNVILYLVAHFIIIIQRQQGATGDSVGKPSQEGYTQSKSVGNVSTSNAVSAFTTQEEFQYGNLTSTSYGKFYLALIKNMHHTGGAFV